MRILVSSGSSFGTHIGFSRAVRVGALVAIAGTAPIAADGIVAAPGDLYGQTRRCLEIIAEAVAEARLTFASVVRTRVMLTDISRWEEAARAHGEVFGEVRPVCTFVVVTGFIDSDWLVEIEVDCVADSDARDAGGRAGFVFGRAPTGSKQQAKLKQWNSTKQSFNDARSRTSGQSRCLLPSWSVRSPQVCGRKTTN